MLARECVIIRVCRFSSSLKRTAIFRVPDIYRGHTYTYKLEYIHIYNHCMNIFPVLSLIVHVTSPLFGTLALFLKKIVELQSSSEWP